MRTFKMTIIRDKAKDLSEDIEGICAGLRERGRYPQGFTYDDNNFYIGGMCACDCSDKFDKAYCDEEGNCNGQG